MIVWGEVFAVAHPVACATVTFYAAVATQKKFRVWVECKLLPVDRNSVEQFILDVSEAQAHLYRW
jgi:hypothetical protein